MGPTHRHHGGCFKPGYAGICLAQLGLGQQDQKVPEFAIGHKAVLLCSQRPATIVILPLLASECRISAMNDAKVMLRPQPASQETLSCLSAK